MEGLSVFEKKKKIIFRFYDENTKLKTKSISVVTRQPNQKMLDTIASMKARGDVAGKTRVTIITKHGSKTRLIPKPLLVDEEHLNVNDIHLIKQTSFTVIIRNIERIGGNDTKTRTFHSTHPFDSIYSYIETAFQKLSEECKNEMVVWETDYRKNKRKPHTHYITVSKSGERKTCKTIFQDYSSNEIMERLIERMRKDGVLY